MCYDEDVREHSRQHFDEALGRLGAQLERIERQLGAHDERFDELGGMISTSFQGIEERMDRRFNDLDRELGSIKGRLDTQATEIDLLQKDVRSIKETLEENVLPRISNLEARVD